VDELLQSVGTWLDPRVIGAFVLQWSGRVFAAIAIFLIGRWIAIALSKWLARGLVRARIDPTLTAFLRSLIYMVFLILVVLTAVGALGVPTTNFLAIVGAAGLAVGLALKDSLSNFSSGVMLVFFRPFRVGDYVETAGVQGNVDSIGIFNTVIKTLDNRVITVPNSLIFSGLITNFSSEAHRRIDLVVRIGYDDDIALARKLIDEVLRAHDKVRESPAPEIVILDLAENSINIAVRAWVNTPDYGPVRGELLEQIKQTFDANGLTAPYPRLRLFGDTPART
jgi:small conductance mechanosensitive channel